MRLYTYTVRRPKIGEPAKRYQRRAGSNHSDCKGVLMATSDLTAARLRELLHYDPKTGVFTWLVRRGGPATAGSAAGTPSRGYVILGIECRRYRANRLAFLYMTGAWPRGFVDHINGNRADDRWSNLRDVSHAENCQNIRVARRTSATGSLGVYERNGRYVASIGVRGARIQIGTFNKREDAADAYLTAKAALHEGAITQLDRDACARRLRELFAERAIAARADNSTGFRGVHLCQGRYQARIQINGEQFHLGTFDSPELAHAAYLDARRERDRAA